MSINFYLVASHLAVVVENSAAFDKEPDKNPYTIAG